MLESTRFSCADAFCWGFSHYVQERTSCYIELFGSESAAHSGRWRASQLLLRVNAKTQGMRTSREIYVVLSVCRGALQAALQTVANPAVAKP
jgi:hypothetical protein